MEVHTELTFVLPVALVRICLSQSVNFKRLKSMSRRTVSIVVDVFVELSLPEEDSKDPRSHCRTI